MGVDLSQESVLELVDALGGEPPATKLWRAFRRGETTCSLTTQDRVSLLRVLDHPSEELSALRERLLNDFRKREERANAKRAADPLERSGALRTRCMIHFPDGATSIAEVVARDLEVGTEILEGWVISHLPQINQREIDGESVSLDVWVDERGSDELEDKLELY